MLPAGHRKHITHSLRRVWLVFGFVLLGVGLEIGLGLLVWQGLEGFGPSPDRSATVWWVGLSVLAAIQGVAAFGARSVLLRPDPLRRRFREAWSQEGLPGDLPPEFLTVAAVRAAFVADVIAWILIQFITIYGLVAMVLVASRWPLAVFSVASLVLLGLSRPRQARVEALAAALHADPPA